jgi:hypothetical protein
MARNAGLLGGLAAALLLCFASAGSAATQASSGALIGHWDGATWTEAPAPAGPKVLGAVAAVSPTDVWAVAGRYADHWDGSTWQAFALPGQGAVDAVTAESASDVWAVGKLIKHWDGTSWTVVPRPPLRLSRLSGVSALSPRDAWAVGAYAGWHKRKPPGKPPCCAYFTSKTFVLHWNGSAWERVRSPNPSFANSSGTTRQDYLFGVTAVSPRSVWAVGTYWLNAQRGRRSYQTLVLHWNGRRWKHVPSPSPGGLRHSDELYSVSSAGPNRVWAVGAYQNRQGHEVPLTERWNGKSWSVVPAPAADPHTGFQALWGVSAYAKDDVWAVGWYLHYLDATDTNYVELPLVEHWDGSSWTISPSPNSDYSDTLHGVAAVSQGDVWAVGAYYNP